jgi:ferredoxin
MTYVVAEPCLVCKDLHCVLVCPTDCFRDGRRMLYIHPAECIDCAACVAACPVNAIFHEAALPEEWVPYRDLNATMARQCRRITRNDRRVARLIPAATRDGQPDNNSVSSPQAREL